MPASGAAAAASQAACPRAWMAEDVNEQVFNEKQLYTGDVVGEDEVDGEASAPSGLAGAAKNGSDELLADRSGAVSSGLSGRERRKQRAALRATQIVYWLESKYDLMYEVCASFPNWKEAPAANSDFDLLWSDQSISADRLMTLKPWQKMNHFVGMSSITRKNNLGRNLLRMRKQFPTEYKFFPDTWILPTDLSDFKLQFSAAKNKTFIIKPDNGCQGKGIFLIRDVDKVPVDFSTTSVAQRYIHRPFLLDGHKFDLRLYVLVTGCDPLRIFLHKRGLCRLASEQYVEPTSKNLANQTVHLTNYAINKLSANFEENTDPNDATDGHKRSWEAVCERLRDEGLDVDTMMQEIEDLIVKTLIAVQPSLSHFYHSCQPDDMENSKCFEILGFDVMMDHKLQPWLIEVNHAPSFTAESELDRIVKHEVLRDTFSLLNLLPESRRKHKREAREKMEQRSMGVNKKQSLEERAQEEREIAVQRTAWEDANLNGYKRLFPSEATEREYMQIHDAAINLWEMLMGGNSRRSVRLTQDSDLPEEKDDKRKGDPSRGGDPDPAPGNVRERRSADEMREAVERLSAGCSARPRESCKPRKRASRLDSGTGQSDGTSTATSSSAVPREDELAEGEAVDDAAKNLKPEPEPKSSSHPRPDVQVNDVIKVQTNLGWENVTVKAKRTNGKIDIQFKDGEYMRSVLPRILRESVPDRSETAEKGSEHHFIDKEANGGQQSSFSTSASSSNPRTARGSTGGNSSSSAAAAASKAMPFTLPTSPIAQARGGLATSIFFSGLQPAMPAKEAPSPAASVAGAAGVIAAAASAIAGSLANADLAGSAPSAPAATSSLPDAQAISSLAALSLESNDRSILAQLQMQKQKRTSNAVAGGEPSARASAIESLPATDKGPPIVNAGRGTGLARPPVQLTPSGMGIGGSPEPNKVHEVRLRNHLQQLISVRPIVTRRKAGGPDDAPKSPRTGSRRTSANAYGNQ